MRLLGQEIVISSRNKFPDAAISFGNVLQLNANAERAHRRIKIRRGDWGRQAGAPRKDLAEHGRHLQHWHKQLLLGLPAYLSTWDYDALAQLCRALPQYLTLLRNCTRI